MLLLRGFKGVPLELDRQPFSHNLTMLEARQVIPLKFRGCEFGAIVIDPDSLGYNWPTVGIVATSRHTRCERLFAILGLEGLESRP